MAEKKTRSTRAEATMKRAKDILHGELSIALDMDMRQVEDYIFIFGGRSLESILDIDGISKLIISKEISVPVVDIASCRHNIPYLLLLQHEIIQIVLTVYYLKYKTSV